MGIPRWSRSLSKQIGWLLLVGAIEGGTEPALAQLRPIADETLGSERSVVEPVDNIRGLPGDRIEGGARRGGNLFHSFQEFNIDEGRAAYFVNPEGIQNILSRVTGGRRSEILGRLGVLGDANLFLINPSGIIFGENASLDLRGSFVATTADAVRLGEGVFSASAPGTSSLLTVHPSALVFVNQINQPIVHRSRFINPAARLPQFTEPSGLQVPADQTLALVGGNLRMDGGVLTATGGRIELGSVNQSGEVRLHQQPQGWTLGYGSIQDFGRIRLQEGAVVNTGILGEGNIQVRASRLRLLDGSRISNQLLVGGRPGGSLIINATDLVELAGINQRIEGVITPGGLGTSTSGTVGGTPGDIEIATRRFIVRDGASVSAASFNPALAAGNIRINASESVLLDGTALVTESPDRLFFTNLATGGPGVTGSLRMV
jgi:filamentous hemagglutinin family protein